VTIVLSGLKEEDNVSSHAKLERASLGECHIKTTTTTTTTTTTKQNKKKHQKTDLHL